MDFRAEIYTGRNLTNEQLLDSVCGLCYDNFVVGCIRVYLCGELSDIDVCDCKFIIAAMSHRLLCGMTSCERSDHGLV